MNYHHLGSSFPITNLAPAPQSQINVPLNNQQTPIYSVTPTQEQLDTPKPALTKAPKQHVSLQRRTNCI